jgi:putative tryptophan/tyrosine transport system substrate-binding protein
MRCCELIHRLAFYVDRILKGDEIRAGDQSAARAHPRDRDSALDSAARRPADRVRRRIALAGLLTIPLWATMAALAQDAGRPRVAVLVPSDRDELLPGSSLHAMLRGLGEFGYVDGKNIALEFRFADHAIERLPTLAAELVGTRPDVLWTYSSGGARAAAAATSTIPIVVGPVNEATMAALVFDFAHPAGNVTGRTLNSREQHEKCLQLLKEVSPSVSRVGVLINPLNPVWQAYPDILADAASALGIEVVRVEARGLAEIDQAFAAIAAQHVEALFVLNESTLTGSAQAAKRILDVSGTLRLPSVSDDVYFARSGGLLALGPDYSAIGHGTALYIHRILQGMKPSELPVVHPTEFKLVVNAKTAEALGLPIPPSILLRADEVLE